MATKQHMDRSRPGMMHRLFVQHPSSLGMSWAGHGIGAVKIGAELIGAFRQLIENPMGMLV